MLDQYELDTLSDHGQEEGDQVDYFLGLRVGRDERPRSDAFVFSDDVEVESMRMPDLFSG